MKIGLIVLLSGLLILPSMAANEVNVEEFVKEGVMMFADTSRDKNFAKDPDAGGRRCSD